MELTREVLEDMARCREIGCQGCRGVCKCNTMGSGIETLAKALLAEMDKPKVWDGAPDDCNACTVNFVKHMKAVSSKAYTRTLPKSRIDKIAEEAAKDYIHNQNGTGLIDMVKSAILRALEEKESNR